MKLNMSPKGYYHFSLTLMKQTGTVALTSTDVVPQKCSHVIKMPKHTQRQNGNLISFVREPILKNTHKLIPI